MAEGMTRAEHLQWCKDRALAELDQGDVQNAIASMLSDLGKHPETTGHGGAELMAMLMAAGHMRDPGEVRKFIEGFN